MSGNPEQEKPLYQTFLRGAGRLVAISALTLSAMPAASVALSGVVSYGSGASGDFSSGITATGGCCQSITVENGVFNNGASGVALPLTLTNGSNTLYFSTSDWTAAFGVSTGALNLFFDGDLAPGISVYGATTYDKTVFNSFNVNSSANSRGLGNNTMAASGSSSYLSGSTLVTLDGMQWVGGNGSNPYNASETVIRVDLTVSDANGTSAAPEPATFVLFGGALVLLGAKRRRTSR